MKSGSSNSNRSNGSVGGQKYWFFIHYLRSAKANPGPQDSYHQDSLDDFPSTERCRVEAALFLAKEGLTSRKLAKLAGLADATEARTLIRQLNDEYDHQGRAFRIEEIAGGYQLMTRAALADWLRKQRYVPPGQQLTQTALETLAIVAYRQPVLRAEIEAIRGVGCSEILRQLMEFDLVRISGRSEELGRPYLYGTTRRFLQMFGLRSVDRLPRVSWVNESRMSIVAPENVGTELEGSAVTKTFTATALMEKEGVQKPEQDEDIRASIEDEENDWIDDDDEDDDWSDDDDWADDEDEEDVDEEEEDSFEEEEEKWEEVSDDDDGWVDEDEDEEDSDEDDDWEEDGEEDEDWD